MRGGGYAQSVNCLNPWDAQSIRQYSPDGVFSSLNAGTGGGQNRAGVCYALQGNGIDRKIENGCNGKGFRENEMYTLDVVDRHAVVYEPKSAMDENWHEAEVKNAIRANASKSSHVIVYGIDPLSSNSMKSSNPHSGFHQQDVAKCLDTSDGNPSKNQGGMCVVYDTRGNGNGETVPTLTGDHQNRVTDYTAVCITAHELMDAEIAHNIDCIGAFVSRMGAKAGNIGFSSKTSPTLKACMSTEVAHTANIENNTGNACVETHVIFRKYIVRRLTPLECCRLQGFPDGWGDTAKKDGFSEEEYRFWLAVRQTKESINGKEPKHYTVAQMLVWYNKLHTDSAEYKMWGNGIALPCAVFVLGGVVEAVQANQYENE